MKSFFLSSDSEMKKVCALCAMKTKVSFCFVYYLRIIKKIRRGLRELLILVFVDLSTITANDGQIFIYKFNI